MKIEIDVDKLRAGLMDYHGTAMTGGAWPAIADLSEVEDASSDELITMAEDAGFNMRDYEAE